MNEPVDGEVDALNSSRVSVRRAAVHGAWVASLAVVAVVAARGHLDGWELGAAILAVGAVAYAFGGRTPLGQPAQGRAIAIAGSESLAEALLAGIPDPVILVDRRAIVIEANRAAGALLPGLRPRHPLSFALRTPDVLDGIEAVSRTGEPVEVEYTERVPTPRSFAVRIAALARRGIVPAESPAIALYFRDLTEARRLEHMRVDFVANASHELRTPLASLLGFVETLQGPARNDAAAREKFLEIMRGQAQRMTRLIDDLLSLSRIEMRAHLPPESPMPLQPILSHMVDTLASLARERGVEIRLDMPEEPLVVRGDRDELLRVVDNLVENAIKYGESGRFVDVRLARAAPVGSRGPEVELNVRDYGPGIAPEHLPRLTERFYRADVAQSREKGGTGLGLAIVKHIVQRHRGRLAIESEPGKGASFSVALPEHAVSPPPHGEERRLKPS